MTRDGITAYIQARTVIDPETGCHNWTKCLNRSGYAISGTLRRLGYSGLVSRAIMQMRQDINDQVVRHTCDNPKCVNEDHLDLGTQQDNIKDMVFRNRQAKGESNGRAKITKELAIEIHMMPGTQKQIAKLFGISKSQVGKIKRGKSWTS